MRSPLQGYTDSVRSVAFSPDGRHIVSGSLNGTIQFWNAQTGGQMERPLQGHTDSVRSVAFSPDGRYIVSGSNDRKIQLWDGSFLSQWSGRDIVSGSNYGTIQLLSPWTSGYKVGNPLQGHTSFVTSVAFSPDRRYIVSGSNDRTIRLWDAQTGGQVGNPLQGHTDSVQSVTFSPDGRHIVSGSYDRTIRFWDAQTGGQVGNSLWGHTDSVNLSAGFLSNERYIVSDLEDRPIQFLEAQIGSTMKTAPPSIIKCPPIHFSSSTEHALYNAENLFLELPNVTEDCRDLVYLQDDGWIVGPNKRLLLWIPSPYHSSFQYTPWTKLVIPRGAQAELDLSTMAHGPAWYKCLSPFMPFRCRTSVVTYFHCSP